MMENNPKSHFLEVGTSHMNDITHYSCVCVCERERERERFLSAGERASYDGIKFQISFLGSWYITYE